MFTLLEFFGPLLQGTLNTQWALDVFVVQRGWTCGLGGYPEAPGVDTRYEFSLPSSNHSTLSISGMKK